MRILVKTGLFLLYAAMVNLLVVSLFAQFIVGGPRFFGDDPCFVKFVLKYGQLIGKLLVALVDWGDVRQLRDVELPSGLQFVPLGLELVESLLHAKLDKEVAEEFVRLLNASLLVA